MSLFKKLQEQLEEVKCLSCLGRGTLNDAEPGDTYFNTWVCSTCNGTGLKFAVSLDIDHYEPIKY